jgi:hypothetical protein
MYVPRAPTWGDLQPSVDALAESGVLGRNNAMEQKVQTVEQLGSHQLFEEELRKKAQCLVERATSGGLPTEVGFLIMDDFQQLGSVLTKLVPAAEMWMKLEIVGEGACSRWHRDYYKGRAIVSYNLCGTEYVGHQHVDFWELDNCGNNDCVVSDSSQVHAADVGGLLFMKGALYPSGEKGLVHKSPEKRKHAHGKVMNRLVLKVDSVDADVCTSWL